MKTYFYHRTGVFANYLTILCLLLLLLAGNSQADDKSFNPTGVIIGRIARSESGLPLPGVNISLSDSIKLKSDDSGSFIIDNLAPGNYILNFSHVGYETEPLDIIVAANDTLRLNITMRESAVNVDDITVFSNKQNALDELSTPHHSIKQEDLTALPKIGEDIYRAVTRVPGVSSNDFSATFKVRGGEHDQVLVLLDGLELYEPFHIKDVDGGILSIIDMDIVESIDLSTGAFSAAYGNHLSGVFNIKTKRPEADKKSLSASIDFLNARCLTAGTFSNNKGNWLASARRGYFEMITKLTDDYEDYSPAYYDFFIKGGFEPGPNHSLTVNLLHAHDDFDYVDDEGYIDTSKSIYDNTYSWLTLSSLLWKKLIVRNTIALGIIDHSRKGRGYSVYDGDLYYDVNDSRNFRYYAIKQDHFLTLSDFYSLQSGVNMNFMKAEYDYFSVQENRYEDYPHHYYYRYDTLQFEKNIEGHTLGAYLSNQLKITPFINTEIGMRYDHHSYIDNDCFSPRINSIFKIRENTSLHGGWGYFYQPQKLYELDIPDGDTSFYAAERAEHYVVGIENIFKNNIQISLEAYYKKVINLKPACRNWVFRTYIYPEAAYDRVKLRFENSRAKGLELSLKNTSQNRLNWKVSYTLSYVEEKLVEYTFGGKDVPTNKVLPGEFDQRHALFIDISYQPSTNWKFSLAWEYHSGWPYTENLKDSTWTYLSYYTFDNIYEKQLPAYHRMDFRLNRIFNTSRGRINIFLEIINLYNHDNVFTYNYNTVYTNDGNYFEKEPFYYLHFLPSLGISWVCEF